MSVCHVNIGNLQIIIFQPKCHSDGDWCFSVKEWRPILCINKLQLPTSLYIKHNVQWSTFLVLSLFFCFPWFAGCFWNNCSPLKTKLTIWSFKYTIFLVQILTVLILFLYFLKSYTITLFYVANIGICMRLLFFFPLGKMVKSIFFATELTASKYVKGYQICQYKYWGVGGFLRIGSFETTSLVSTEVSCF